MEVGRWRRFVVMKPGKHSLPSMRQARRVRATSVSGTACGSSTSIGAAWSFAGVRQAAGARGQAWRIPRGLRAGDGHTPGACQHRSAPSQAAPTAWVIQSRSPSARPRWRCRLRCPRRGWQRSLWLWRPDPHAHVHNARLRRKPRSPADTTQTARLSTASKRSSRSLPPSCATPAMRPACLPYIR